MTDIVDRLRDRAYCKVPDRLAAEAADEIERLRLTPDELGAVAIAAHTAEARCHAEQAAVLRGLLERLG